MTDNHRAVLLTIATGALLGLGILAAQQAGNTGRGSTREATPLRTDFRLPNWGQIRTATTGILDWTVAVPADGFRSLTFAEALSRADALRLANVTGSSAQDLSPDIPKRLDYRLTRNELTAVTDRLRDMSIRMPAYFAPAIGADSSDGRRLFEFAKTLGVEMIVASPEPESLAMLDGLANEFGINVAIRNGGRKDAPAYWNPENFLQTVEGRSKRIGAYADVGNWMQEGIQPSPALARLKERLLGVHLRDRSALGSAGRDVPLGTGVAGLEGMLRQLHALGAKPLLLTVDPADAADAFSALSRSLERLEAVVQPLMAERLDEISRATPLLRVTPQMQPAERQKLEERVSADLKRYGLSLAEARQRIESTLGEQTLVKAKRPRKLLVMDLNVGYGGHISGRFLLNYLVEFIAEKTGAYEVLFSNDLNQFKYDKIKQYDAVFLNSTVGMLFADPEVREGLTRFVREGGGLGGNHGTSHASMDWPEFGEMLGTFLGTHRENDEQAMLKIDDPASPLTQGFRGQGLLCKDEFYRFPEGPYSRDKLHVLLSIDVAKTDMNQGRPCSRPCSRPDHDYAISWIRSYGKGRVFYSVLGHQPAVFLTPAIASHFLAGIQFILGDLEADTTPSARLATAK